MQTFRLNLSIKIYISELVSTGFADGAEIACEACEEVLTLKIDILYVCIYKIY